MEDRDCVDELGFFGGFAALGDRDVDFGDPLRFAEISQRFCGIWGFQDTWAFP